MEGELTGPRLTERELRRWLARMPKRIGMTKIRGPFVQTIPEGLVGICVIAESHLAVHLLYDRVETIPEPNVGMLTLPAPYAYVDIFSCRSFDTAHVIEVVRAELGMRIKQLQVVPRGLEYLTAMEPAPPARPESAGFARDRAWPWQAGSHDA